MKILFRMLKTAFLRFLVEEGLEVIEKEALKRLQENQKRVYTRKPSKIAPTNNEEISNEQ